MSENWNGTGKNKTYSTSHLHYWKEELASGSIVVIGNTDRIRELKWERDFLLLRVSFQSRDPPSMVGHTFFTDGSKTDAGVGSGFVSFHNNHRLGNLHVKLDARATVFQAEVLAITKAAEYIASHWGLFEGKHITLHTDSAAALRAIDNHLVHSRVVKDAIQS